MISKIKNILEIKISKFFVGQVASWGKNKKRGRLKKLHFDRLRGPFDCAQIGDFPRYTANLERKTRSALKWVIARVKQKKVSSNLEVKSR